MKNPSLENKKDQRDLQVRRSELRALAKTLSQCPQLHRDKVK